MSSNADPPSALYGTASTSRLELLPDTDDRDLLQEYSDDDDTDDTDQQPIINQLPIPPLAPAAVFLYLLSPYLRLGAIYATDIRSISLRYCLVALCVAAALSALCRHIWFLLGRYLRRSSTEDILIHAFARRRRRIFKYGLARYSFAAISALFRILLAAMYLRDSVDSVLLLKVPESIPTPSRFNVSLVLSILVFVLSLPKSLASKSVIYTTCLSVASYLAWLVALSQSYGANEHLLPNTDPPRRGILWNEISSYVFACTTAMTVPLSASLIVATPLVPPASRNSKSRSFALLNVLSTVLAILFLFPLVIVTASPRAQVSNTSSMSLILALRAATLVLSIPSVVISVISLPLYASLHRFMRTDLALSLITVAVFALSLAPPAITTVLNDITLFLAVFGTFLLPALAHITIHYFRRPLSIVVPYEPSSVPSTPRTSDSERSPSPSRDPLLQRKERLLQRRRFGKRFLWDIVAWLVLVPVSACALLWVVGRLAQHW